MQLAVLRRTHRYGVVAATPPLHHSGYSTAVLLRPDPHASRVTVLVAESVKQLVDGLDDAWLCQLLWPCRCQSRQKVRRVVAPARNPSHLVVHVTDGRETTRRQAPLVDVRHELEGVVISQTQQWQR